VTLAIVLTVSRTTNTRKTMTLNNTLETLTFRGTDSIDEVADFENGEINLLTGLKRSFEGFELNQFKLGSYAGFFKVPLKWLAGAFLTLIAITELNGILTILLFCFDLRQHIWGGFHYCASLAGTVLTVKGGHTNFFSNDS
jgi:hypothetical protein